MPAERAAGLRAQSSRLQGATAADRPRRAKLLPAPPGLASRRTIGAQGLRGRPRPPARVPSPPELAAPGLRTAERRVAAANRSRQALRLPAPTQPLSIGRWLPEELPESETPRRDRSWLRRAAAALPRDGVTASPRPPDRRRSPSRRQTPGPGRG